MPLLVHCFYLIIMDCYFVKLGQKTVGKKATSIALIPYICGSLFNQQLHRLWSSSYETMLGTISLYYYINLKPEMDFNLMMLCILQSISFVIRNTSPIAWVVLLLLKAWELRWHNKDKKSPDNQYMFLMILQYLKVFLVIFLPIFIIATGLDSMFYGKLTCVPWNFIKINVFES